LDCAHRLSTDSQSAVSAGDGRLRPWRHGAYIFHFTKEAWEVDLGSWSSIPITYGNEHLFGAGKVGNRAVRRLQIAFLFPKLTEEQKKMMLEKKLKQMEEQPPQKK
jgi:hypothetical protein